MKTTLLLLTLLFTFTNAQEGNIAMHGTEKAQNVQIFYGKVLEIKDAMGYKYLKIDENGTEVWIAIANAPVVVGDKIGYDKQMKMKDFESKSLGQKFEAIYFASDVHLPQKASRPKSMKELLAQRNKSKDPHTGVYKKSSHIDTDKKPTKPFVTKETYTIEEVHMWSEALKDQTITMEVTVGKVLHNIMKRDWVHVSDGSGHEKSATNDLVLTAASSTVKQGDKVRAKGKVIVDKDFGFGYFYKVILQDVTFEVLK